MPRFHKRGADFTGARGRSRGHLESGRRFPHRGARIRNSARRSRPVAPRGAENSRSVSNRSPDPHMPPPTTGEEGKSKDLSDTDAPSIPQDSTPTDFFRLPASVQAAEGSTPMVGVTEPKPPRTASEPTTSDHSRGEGIQSFANLTTRSIPGVPTHLCQALVDRALPRLLVYDLCKELRLSLEADDRGAETIKMAQRKLKWLLSERLEELSESCDIEIENEWAYLFM